MALLDIRKAGDPVLKEVCQPVEKIDKKLKQLLDDMADTMYESDGVGIAAPQVGIHRRVVAVQRLDKEGEPFEIYPNIRIKEYLGGTVRGREGCLSLPGVRKTTRFRTIKVRYQNQRLQTRIQTFTGWTAQIIQHEIDHLHGILI